MVLPWKVGEYLEIGNNWNVFVLFGRRRILDEKLAVSERRLFEPLGISPLSWPESEMKCFSISKQPQHVSSIENLFNSLTWQGILPVPKAVTSHQVE